MATVRLFAMLREVAQTDRLVLDAERVSVLLNHLTLRFGDEFARSLGFSKVAVNGVLIDELDGLETALNPSDEVALLPPVSGG